MSVAWEIVMAGGWLITVCMSFEDRAQNMALCLEMPSRVSSRYQEIFQVLSP